MFDGKVWGVKENAAVVVVAPHKFFFGFGVWEGFHLLSLTLIIGR